MYADPPPAEQIVMQKPDLLSLAERLKKWDPQIKAEKLELICMIPTTWNNGSLGCPMPGKCYTQALVPGYSIWLQYEDMRIEVHTDRSMKSIALPGIGFI